MGFGEFLGHPRTVTILQEMLAAGRVPHSMLFTGPRGIGKYTLARMFAQAANCERLKDDSCGVCDSCRRIGLLADPESLIEQGLAERGENPDSATVERIPLILETHPDVWAIVPDPVRPQNRAVRPVIRVGQLRAVQRAAHFRPFYRRRVFILDGAETMRWDLANIFLKILEEPPETATLILLAPSPDLLLPTIRSRCLHFSLAPLADEQVEAVLKKRSGMKASERKLAAQFAEGSPGLALRMDVEEATRLRRDILRLLECAVEARSYARLFRETSELAKNQKESFENVLDVFYSVLTDLLELTTGPKSCVLRNPALRQELEALSRKIDFDWLGQAVGGVDQLHGRLRRNINRQLGLDAVAVSLARR